MTPLRKRKALIAIDWVLILLLLVVTFMFILPDYFKLKNKLAESICQNNRIVLREAVREYLKKYPYLHNTSLNPKLLLDVGFLDKLPVCPKLSNYEILIHENSEFQVKCKFHGE